MKYGLSSCSQSARCFMPGNSSGCCTGVYGTRGLMQLEWTNVYLLSLNADICPGRGAVVNVPVLLPLEVLITYSYGVSDRRWSRSMTEVKSVSFVNHCPGCEA